jgi:DnaK suppressor protein
MDEARARELLQAERTRIEAALRSAQTGPATEELSDDDDHLGDLATDTYQAELDETRRDELNEQLRALERAEQRLANGTYGRSVVSGDPIPDERLEVEPWAERTAAEQEAFERGA